jgi:2-haloacid dehalogenase
MSDPHRAEGSRYYQSFWDITRSALLYTLERFKLDAKPEHVEALMGQYTKLTPFAENLGVLQSLKERGIATAILSNGSMDMLSTAVSSAGMTDLIDHVISVDPNRPKPMAWCNKLSSPRSKTFCLCPAMAGTRWVRHGLASRPCG